MEKNSIDVIGIIIDFKKAVAEGSLEEGIKAEKELREAFKNLGLGEELTKYLIAHFRSATLIEEAHKKKCEILQEVRRTILRLTGKIF